MGTSLKVGGPYQPPYLSPAGASASAPGVPGWGSLLPSLMALTFHHCINLIVDLIILYYNIQFKYNYISTIILLL